MWQAFFLFWEYDIKQPKDFALEETSFWKRKTRN